MSEKLSIPYRTLHDVQWHRRLICLYTPSKTVSTFSSGYWYMRIFDFGERSAKASKPVVLQQSTHPRLSKGIVSLPAGVDLFAPITKISSFLVFKLWSIIVFSTCIINTSLNTNISFRTRDGIIHLKKSICLNIIWNIHVLYVQTHWVV